MLLAISGSVGLCAALGAAGEFQPGEPAHVDFSAIGRSEWVRVKSLVFPWGLPSLKAGAIVAVLAGYLASMIESFGDYHACKEMAGGGDCIGACTPPRT